MSFRRTWTRFRRAPRVLSPTPGVREAWHQGRRWYHVSVLRISDPRVRDRRDAVRDALGGAVVPFCEDEPHVTVWVHGFAPPPSRRGDGARVPVTVGRANAFLSCPFLEVRAPIGPLRAEFAGEEERWAPYRPHLTVARFAHPISTDAVIALLRPWRRATPIHTTGVLTHMVVDAWDEAGGLYPASVAMEAAVHTPRSVT